MILDLLNDPEMSSLYLFVEVDLLAGDLSGLDGLMVTENDFSMTEAKALVLRAFFDSRRPIFLGMDDLDENWNGAVPGLLSSVRGRITRTSSSRR